MKHWPSIIEAVREPKLLGGAFPDLSPWNAWLVFLRALFALPMSDEGLSTYRAHTDRETMPKCPAKEAWLVVGRRGGKSRIAALIAVYLALFRDYSKILAPGERGTVMVIAQDRRQARVVHRYISGLLDASPLLAREIQESVKESIHLRNRISIEIHTSNFRSVRGYSVVAAVCDEIAFLAH